MLEPTFVDKPAFLAAGALYHGTNQNREITLLWEKDFRPRLHEVKNVHPDLSYGVCGDFDPETGAITYLAGVEVASPQDVPEGMQLWEVPAAHYAVFEHHGSLNHLQETMNTIFTVWLPRSGLKQSARPMLEVYQMPEFKGEDPDSVLYLYIAIEK